MIGLSFACSSAKTVKTTPNTRKPPSEDFCDFAYVKKRIKVQRVKLKKCSEAARAKGLVSEGKLSAYFRILLNGKVEHRSNVKGSTRILKSDITDPDFQVCVLKTINTFTFDKPKGGMCTIRTSFTFGAEE